MGPPQSQILSGMFGLLLSLATWKLTGSAIGWLVLFIPGAALTCVGTIRALIEALKE